MKLASGCRQTSTMDRLPTMPICCVEFALIRLSTTRIWEPEGHRAPGYSLVRFMAGAAREKSLAVVHKPVEDNPAHTEVIGKKTQGRCESSSRCFDLGSSGTVIVHHAVWRHRERERARSREMPAGPAPVSETDTEPALFDARKGKGGAAIRRRGWLVNLCQPPLPLVAMFSRE